MLNSAEQKLYPAHKNLMLKCEQLIVGILTFISMILNATPERIKKLLYLSFFFSFYEHLNFLLKRVEHEKSFITRFSGKNIKTLCMRTVSVLASIECLAG